MPKKSILVTGAGGLLGTRVVQSLIKKGYHVIAAIKPGSKKIKNAECLEIDLSKEFSLEGFDSPEAIFHLAQASGHTNFKHSASNISSVSISALCRLAEFACKNGVKRLIFTSSGGIYGGGPSPFKESDPIQNASALSFYLETKWSSEKLLSHFAKDIETIILRPFFIYGPSQREEMLISRLRKSILEKKEIFLAKSQGPTLNPIHVDDAVKATIACAEGEVPKIINIAGNEQVSLRRICEILGESLDIKPIFSRKKEVPLDFLGDNYLMRKHLHVPEISIEEGLKKL